jgi:hypothetical protein
MISDCGKYLFGMIAVWGIAERVSSFKQKYRNRTYHPEICGPHAKSVEKKDVCKRA